MDSKRVEELEGRYITQVQILKALSHPIRLWILEILGSKELCVCEIVKLIDLDFSTISKHLKLMKQAGLIDSDKRGKYIYYKLAIPCILDFVSCLADRGFKGICKRDHNFKMSED